MFDIDKLFLSCIQYKINREEGDDGKYHQTASDQFDDDSNEAIKNDLLRCYLTLLTDKRSANFLHRSIDLDTKLLKGIVKDIEEGKETDVEEPYGFYSLSRQVTSKNDYVTGKIGIGPFALNNNNHILTMMYGVRFKGSNSSIMSEFGLERLDRRIGNDGESIMSWISALINAHVDIAKDPYITRLNVNPFTYNLVNLLIRTGFGKDTFYFTSQPIMRILSSAYVNAGSMYMSDSFGSKYRLQEEAVEKTAEDLFYDAGITVLGYDPKTIIKWIKEGGKNHSKFIKSLNEEIHRSFAENLRSDAKLFDVTQESLTRQFLVYAAYLQFSKYANALSGLVSYSKIDTKKHGKSVVEQIFYRDKYRNVYDTTRADNVFESDGLRRMRTESYIGLKTENAINTVLDIMSNQFIEATPAFLSLINTLTKAIGRQDSTSANLIKSLSKALSAAIKSKFFVDEYVPKISSIPSYFHDLVSESQEDLDFVIKQEGNVLKISGNTNYPLSSYVRGGIAITYKGADGKNYTISSKILGVDEKNGNITISRKLPRMYGKVRLLNGKNTIYHRFFKLQADIRSKKEFSKLRSESGEPKNRLLQMIVSGNEIEYTTAYIPGEHADTYQNAFFIKLFNFVESSGDESNYIITAWDELLNYSDENKEVENTVREFARDLVVYSFITSGDKSGFTKMFKYVPSSWRKESGYADFINKKRTEYGINADIDIDFRDVLLNNWFDNQLVPTYHLQDPVDNSSVFMTYYTKRNGIRYGYPTMLAALKHDGGNLTPSIDPQKAPIFIKIPRRKDRSGKDSQRRYTIYKLLSIARSINGVDYPVYVKTNPKGNSISGGFLITEYGRNDNLFENEYAANEDAIKKAYMAGTISSHVNILKNTEPVYAAILSGLAKHYQLGQDSTEEDDMYDDVVLNDTDSIAENDDQQLDEDTDRQQILSDYTSTPSNYEGLIQPEENTVFVFGSNPQGIHGAGAAATAKSQFGAIEGRGEGLQGNAYALPTKDLDKAKGTRWYRPGKKEETEVKEWYKNHDYSEVHNHPLNTERTMTPQQIIESIKKLYEVARQNPNKQFKVSHYPFGQLSLNGYLGEEMLAMFKQAGQVPSNVVFNKEWTDHWNAVQPTRFEYAGNANGTIAMRQHSRKLNDTEIKFGRKLISPSESKYVTEKIFLSAGFNQYTEDELNRFLNIQRRVTDILYGNISPEETVDIKYSDWKQMLQHDRGLITLTSTFEMFVENSLIDELADANFIYDRNAYDKQNKTLRVGRVAYELIKLLSDNVDYLRFLYNISPSNNIEEILLSEDRQYADVSDMITTLISSNYEDGFVEELSDEKIEQNIIKNLIDLRYTYEDSRQLNIFDDSDFSDEAMKHCKG